MNKLIQKYLNKEAVVTIGGLTVDVLIKDVKTSYGRDRFLISPKSGKGDVWVEKIKLKDA